MVDRHHAHAEDATVDTPTIDQAADLLQPLGHVALMPGKRTPSTLSAKMGDTAVSLSIEGNARSQQIPGVGSVWHLYGKGRLSNGGHVRVCGPVHGADLDGGRLNVIHPGGTAILALEQGGAYQLLWATGACGLLPPLGRLHLTVRPTSATHATFSLVL
jgi:hypothetical protein